MKKTKALLTLVLSSSLLISSCSWIQKGLTFKIITFKGGDSYPFLSYADDTDNCAFVTSSLVYDAFFTSEYDFILYDLAKGIELIQNKNVPFKLARVTGCGNAYVVKRGEVADGEAISSFDNVISYDYAYSRYDTHTYTSMGIQNSLFIKNNAINNNAIDTFYDDVKDTYNHFISGEGDYAILNEPYVSRLLNDKNGNYHLFQNLVSTFCSVETDYARVPSIGLFISNRLENAKEGPLKDARENFLISIDKNLSDLSQSNGNATSSIIKNYYDDKKIDLIDYFGAEYGDICDCLNGNKNPNGVNALGFCSYTLDLDSFARVNNLRRLNVFVDSIAPSVYSSFYK